jgi:hypothetical protein
MYPKEIQESISTLRFKLVYILGKRLYRFLYAIVNIKKFDVICFKLKKAANFQPDTFPNLNYQLAHYFR